ncbi:MAG: hypothetical protein L3K26_19065 [Candidatus Hydrogenedentes bacterium]|nr:hypothetical protein [Candidatus Hydrogenedentota bacterium]
MTETLTVSERREVERHKYCMSSASGYDVGFEVAYSDWLEKHAEPYRRETQARMLDMQREEIARHTWIESEKANRDLGREAALDWVLNYAAQWRTWYNATYAD